MIFIFSICLVAIGAAIQAAILQRPMDVPRVLLKSVTPLSLGIRLANGRMRTLIKRNTAYPTEGTCTGKTLNDDQEGVSIVIFEGEHQEAKFNKCLGIMTVTGIEKCRKGEAKVDITLKMNRLAELSATVIVQKTKAKTSMVFKRPKQFSEQQLLKMKNDITQLPKANNSNDEQVNKKEVGNSAKLGAKRMKRSRSDAPENDEHFDEEISVYPCKGASSSFTEHEEIELS